MTTAIRERQLYQQDLFELDDEWTEEQKAIIETCRRFIDDEVLPTINKDHNDGRLPEGIYEKIGALGILELVAAGELEPISYGLVSRECDRGSCALGRVLSVSVPVVGGRLRARDGVVKAVLVDTSLPGFDAQPIKEKWSFRTSDTGMFFLNNVEVPESALMPGATSLGKAIATLNNARYGIVWGVVGAARACFDEALQYLINRPQFDNKPLASHQLIQNKLAWMVTEITALELLAKRLGALK